MLVELVTSTLGCCVGSVEGSSAIPSSNVGKFELLNWGVLRPLVTANGALVPPSCVQLAYSRFHFNPSNKSAILTFLSCRDCQTFSSIVPSATTTIVSVFSVCPIR